MTDLEFTSANDEQMTSKLNDDPVLIVRWIPTGESLPPNDEPVLTTSVTPNGVRIIRRALYRGGRWFGSRGMLRVIAWMPLPEPYMEEKA